MPPDRVTVVALGAGDLSAEALQAVAGAEHVLGHDRLLDAARHLAPPSARVCRAAGGPGALAVKAASTQGRVTVLVEPTSADDLVVALADVVPDVPVIVLGSRG